MPINSFLYPGAKVTTGYDVANSLRFNDGSSDYLDHTHNAVTSTRKQTFSFWVKRGALGSYISLISTRNGSGTDRDIIAFTSDDQFDVRYGAGSSSPIRLTTNRKFRDVSAWYHIVVAVDTTQATDSNRIKVYVNGTQETSFATSNYMSQNYDFALNAKTDQTTDIGNDARSDGSYFDGYFAEFVAIDGSQLDQTSFGEFDSDSPNIWKPIDVSGLTFGNAGFHLDFEDSSALGNDVSGNDNDFSVSNLTAVDQSTDTCTNNFATFNNLLGNNRQGSQLTFSEANLKVQDSGGSNDPYIPSTIGVTKGKWYAELKLDAYSEDGHAFGISATNGDFSESIDNQFCILQYATKGADNLPRIYNFGDLSDNNLSDSDPGDIIGCAVDIDNGTVNFTVNGSAYGSQVTGLTSNFSGKTIFFIIRGEGGGSRTFTSSVNFGSPSFSISSGNSDANGHGNFEYSVPSGYFALCTKNLAEFG